MKEIETIKMKQFFNENRPHLFNFRLTDGELLILNEMSEYTGKTKSGLLREIMLIYYSSIIHDINDFKMIKLEYGVV